jgi:hypothetical protein
MKAIREVAISTLLWNASRAQAEADAASLVWKSFRKEGYYFPNDPPKLDEVLVKADPRMTLTYWLCDIEREQISLA